MSNTNSIPPMGGLGIGPATLSAGDGQRIGDVTRHEIDTLLPNGKEAIVGLRIGDDFAGDPVRRESLRVEFLTHTHPPSLTEGLERDLERLEEQWQGINGYDREGSPLFRVNGRDREILEMKLANRKKSLQRAWEQRRAVESYQAKLKAEAAAREAKRNAAAEIRAEEIAEEIEVERRAKLIAARMAKK